MAGINFNQLPKDLQAKLQPYMTVGGAKTVEEAIAKARFAGAWSDSDQSRLDTLNGGANWGKTMDEFAFDSSKADKYKADAQKNEYAQAKKGKKEQSTGSKVGHYLAEGAKILLALTPLGMTSCSNDIHVDQGQAVTIPRESYKNQLDQILKRLENIDNGIANQYKVFLGQLQVIIDNQNDTKASMEFQFNNLMSQIKNWLEQIVENQIAIKTDNNKNAAAILEAIKAIIDSGADLDVKMKDLMALLNQIKTVSEDILAEVKKAKDDLKATLNTNNKDVLNAIAKLDDNDQKTLSVLNDIKALINKFGDDGRKLGEKILVAIGNVSGNVDLSKVIELLEKLLKGQKVTNDGITNMANVVGEFKAKNQEQLDVIISKLDKINAAIEKLGGDVTFGMNAILNAIKELPKASDFDAKLDAILQKLDALGDTAKDILKAIKDHDVKITVDVTGKVKCECNCNCGSTHEGIIGNLTDLLG